MCLAIWLLHSLFVNFFARRTSEGQCRGESHTLGVPTQSYPQYPPTPADSKGEGAREGIGVSDFNYDIGLTLRAAAAAAAAAAQTSRSSSTNQQQQQQQQRQQQQQQQHKPAAQTSSTNQQHKPAAAAATVRLASESRKPE